MHKIFGTKHEVPYVDRKGAYIIPSHNGKIGVVQTSKGFFFLGGGIDENETDLECIQRECMEEVGCTAVVKDFICSAESYTEHPVIGHFHPIQTYYTGEIEQQVQAPLEADHKLVWLTYAELKGNMFAEMQNWALEQYNEFEETEKDTEIVELTAEEIDEIILEEQIEDGAYGEAIPEYYFSNPDPYFKMEPRPDDAPKRDIKFDEKGNIVVKNPSAFWLPDVKIVEEIGGTEITVTGSYKGTETLDKKLKRIVEQNAADDKNGITEDGE